jgi:hypothetical protein
MSACPTKSLHCMCLVYSYINGIEHWIQRSQILNLSLQVQREQQAQRHAQEESKRYNCQSNLLNKFDHAPFNHSSRELFANTSNSPHSPTSAPALRNGPTLLEYAPKTPLRLHGWFFARPRPQGHFLVPACHGLVVVRHVPPTHADLAELRAV